MTSPRRDELPEELDLPLFEVRDGRVGAGVSGNNTAKVTALQSTMLSTITGIRGAAIGDTRLVRLPAGDKEYEVVAISYPAP